ncbi:MAG: SpoIID/LytB domain-containing protein [Enterocloster sp.]
MKRFLTVLMIMVMIPYVTTMAWTGRIGGGDFTGFEELAGAGGEGSQGGSLGTDGNGAAGRRYVAVEREGKVSRVPAEDFLVHVLAAQIPADFGPETLKAQAVIARRISTGRWTGGDPGGGPGHGRLERSADGGAVRTYQEDYSRMGRRCPPPAGFT